MLNSRLPVLLLASMTGRHHSRTFRLLSCLYSPSRSPITGAPTPDLHRTKSIQKIWIGMHANRWWHVVPFSENLNYKKNKGTALLNCTKQLLTFLTPFILSNMFCNYVALYTMLLWWNYTPSQLTVAHYTFKHMKVRWTTTVRTLPPQDSMHQTVSSVTFTASITHNTDSFRAYTSV